MKKLRSIFNGWYNYLFPDADTEKLAKERATICGGCIHSRVSLVEIVKDRRNPKISGRHCEICMCPLATKIRSWEESCALDVPKWNGKVRKNYTR
jgi:hypothetical protein